MFLVLLFSSYLLLPLHLITLGHKRIKAQKLMYFNEVGE